MDFAHKNSLRLIKKYDFIVFEDLNIRNMQINNVKQIKKSISDVTWDRFTKFTQYKAEKAGKQVMFVDPKNTSKMCSNCGSLVPKLLSDRIHICSCGLSIDRDLNAAINILRRGLASLATA